MEFAEIGSFCYILKAQSADFAEFGDSPKIVGYWIFVWATKNRFLVAHWATGLFWLICTPDSPCTNQQEPRINTDNSNPSIYSAPVVLTWAKDALPSTCIALPKGAYFATEHNLNIF